MRNEPQPGSPSSLANQSGAWVRWAREQKLRLLTGQPDPAHDARLHTRETRGTSTFIQPAPYSRCALGSAPLVT